MCLYIAETVLESLWVRPMYCVEYQSKLGGRRSRRNSGSLRILHARTNEVCFVGGNLRWGVSAGGLCGWRVMYTRARGVEVGKWPARRARRPRSLAISIRESRPHDAMDTARSPREGGAASQKHSFVCLCRSSPRSWERTPCLRTLTPIRRRFVLLN